MSGIGNNPGIPVDKTGGIPVNVQDQTTKPVIVRFNKLVNESSLSVAAVKGAKEITVAGTTGFTAGSYIILFDVISKNFSFYTQIGAPVGNVITLDTPIDFAYPIGTVADSTTTNLAVDGSSAPQTFGLRGVESAPGVEITVDFTSISYFCLTTNAVDLASFGDQTALTNGLVFRRRNDIYQNITNIKSNAEIAALSPESFTITSATNPVQGQHGFYGSSKFAGQENIGVAIRLPLGEDAEFIVQDKLDTTIQMLSISAIGHVIQD